MITKQVTFIAKEDCIDQMQALLHSMVQASKAEDGCLLYDIYQLKEEPRKFIVIESWRDENALDGHKASAHYNHYKTHYEPYCEDKYSYDLEIV